MCETIQNDIAVRIDYVVALTALIVNKELYRLHGLNRQTYVQSISAINNIPDFNYEISMFKVTITIDYSKL